jgi:hypothetical protein
VRDTEDAISSIAADAAKGPWGWAVAGISAVIVGALIGKSIAGKIKK